MSPLVKPFTDRKIRLGFVGCGRISQQHFNALEQHREHIEVVAVCDLIKDRGTKAATVFGTKSYTDLSTMLASEILDVVTIATPNGLHPKQVMQVADHGVHVITEKPMAIHWEDGLKMQQHCRDHKIQLFVIHQNRFNDTILALHKAKQANRFGKIYMITSNVFWTRPQDYYDKDGTWHGTKDMDGGAYLTQASHYVDLMQWIAGGKPTSVYANLKTLARNIETEDTGVATFEWDNGIIGAMNVTMLTYPKNLEGSVTVLGEKGTVRIGGVAMNTIEHWQFADTQPEDSNILSANYETASVYGFGHVRYYENIIQVFRGKATPLIDGEEGLKSLRLLTSIYTSNEQKKPFVL
jgi:UDP-N-acetyl-2-amino-2-deoxyglucuronate dehydrogenase